MIKTLISLPRSLLARLKDRAKAATTGEDRYVSVAELVRRAIRQSLDERSKENGSDDSN